MSKRRTRVLICKLGLDTHWRGAMVVAHIFRDAGMEVVYIGNATPAEIVQTALDEDVDVIGLSSLGGAHLTLGEEVLKQGAKSNLEDKIYLIGGIIPPEDEKKLLELGFDGVFGPGATGESILGAVKRLIEAK